MCVCLHVCKYVSISVVQPQGLMRLLGGLWSCRCSVVTWSGWLIEEARLVLEAISYVH